MSMTVAQRIIYDGGGQVDPSHPFVIDDSLKLDYCCTEVIWLTYGVHGTTAQFPGEASLDLAVARPLNFTINAPLSMYIF